MRIQLKTDQFLIVTSLWVIISFTPLANWLENDIRLHMLVQIPLLAMLGYYFFYSLVPDDIEVKHGQQSGYASVLVTSFAALYWMIPKSLDAALSYEISGLLKYLSIPLLIGTPLALGWRRIGPIFRGFVIIEFLAMLFRLGWLYRDSPIRLCSNYGLYEQNSLGNYLIVIALILSLYWAAKCFYPETNVFATSTNRNIHSIK